MSRWLYRFERRLAWERSRRWAIALLSLYLILYWSDRAIFHGLYVGGAARDSFEHRQVWAMLKSVGYLPAWLAVGGALALAGRRMDGIRIAAAAALGGGLAEVLKPILGQVRPLFTDGIHRFRHAPGFDDSAISFGMASSHVGVAFGAAFTVLLLYGRPGWVALALACGCGVERVMAGSHFATDVYVGALMGYASARLLRPGGWSGEIAGRKGLLLP